MTEERSKCQHTRVIFEHGSNTGNYDLRMDCYWNDVKCIDCGETFWFDSDKDDWNYRLCGTIGSEFKMKKEDYETFLEVQKQLGEV